MRNMRGVSASILLLSGAWVKAREPNGGAAQDASYDTLVDHLLGNLADELFVPTSTASIMHFADNTTLGRLGHAAIVQPGYLDIPPSANLRRSRLPSSARAPSPRRVHGFPNQCMGPRPARDRDVLTMAKKKKGGGGGGSASYNKQAKAPTKQQQQSREDSTARKFMFTMLGLTKKLPDASRTILNNINLCFFPGAKIGIVGLNGAGKSSLLKIMAGVDKEFEGTAVPMPGASVGYLAQEPELPGKTVIENVDLAVEKSQNILNEFNEVSAKMAEVTDDNEMTQLLDKMATLQDQIDAGDLWELERFKERAMDSLRCPAPEDKVEVLSGGEKRRVALTKLILENHDMILLDEPTNHLDAESVAWLEQYLSEFKGTVVAITHDRYFLENTCQWILELDRGEGIPFEGHYSDWLETKSKRLANEKKQDQRLQKTLANELEWIKQTPSGRGTKSKARLNRYDELLREKPREAVTQSATIYIPKGPRLGNVVIQAKNVNKAFGDKLLMKDMSFSIPPGAIVGVIGPNGAGKTTLMKMIMGQEQPDSGEFIVGDSVQIACVDQSRENLDPTKTAFEEITGGTEFVELGEKVEVNSRQYCTWFGFRAGDQQKKVEVLSGGERNRVQLGKLLRTGANVILLDEPTNDLDVNTIRSLEEALLDFAGCAVVVSHDRYFLDRVATHIMAFEGNSNIRFFNGNFQEYEEYKKQIGLTDGPKRVKFAKVS